MLIAYILWRERVPLPSLAGMALALCAALPARAQQAPAAPPALPDLQGCASRPILERFEAFGRTGRMPPDLGRWLNDPQAQYVAPYQAFDNVYYVGVCWVSAWLIKTSEGAILIDGQRLTGLQQRSVRMRLGMVPQDVVLFNDTVEYNIRCRSPSRASRWRH